MKAFAFVAAALALCACQKSADQQFEEMYAYQQKHDPDAAAVTSGAYQNRANLSDEQKKVLVDTYVEIRKAREAIGEVK